MEEFYRVAAQARVVAEQEKDPELREELLDTVDEYAELIQLLKDA